MGPFAGRGDNMVKLRGVNVWPEALAEVALDDPRLETDYFVRAMRRHRVHGADDAHGRTAAVLLGRGREREP